MCIIFSQYLHSQVFIQEKTNKQTITAIKKKNQPNQNTVHVQQISSVDFIEIFQ